MGDKSRKEKIVHVEVRVKQLRLSIYLSGIGHLILGGYILIFSPR